MQKTKGKNTVRFYSTTKDGDNVFIERKLTKTDFHRISQWLMNEDVGCTVDKTEIVTPALRREEKNAKAKLVHALARAKNR